LATPIPANRARFSVREIAAATAGRAVDLPEDHQVAGVSTDSRTVGDRELFVALVGQAHDGHAYVETVRARGAVPLVRADRGASGPRIEVDDTLIALGALARSFVERETAGRNVPTLAIGGAAGKTTTKTLAAAAVGALFGETLVTAGNLNNRIGVPMTLFTLEPRHRAIVLEHGTSERGEIAALARISNPDVGLVVNVGVEHSEGLGSVEEIADEEATLLLAARRFAVTNGDEPLLVERLARAAAEPLIFGTASGCHLRLASRSVDDSGRSSIAFRTRGRLFGAGVEGRELRFTTRLLGEHVAMNVAAAVLAAIAILGRAPDADEVAALETAIAGVEAVPGRLRPREIGGVFVVDDTYNSNPRSARAALAAAREIADRRAARLVVALGDMLELGPLAASEHLALLRAADRCGAAELLLVGPELFRAAEATRASFNTLYRAFSSSTDAAAKVNEAVGEGDVLLVKGSRGMRMERLIDALESEAKTS
jgi:UDP-N-acetylmuramoyl-tripeptide--D-alanyl-D-alanine ligase